MLTNTDPAAFENKISLSEIATLLRCKKKWEYAYLQRIEPASPTAAVSGGNYLHAMLEKYLRRFQEGVDDRDVDALSLAVLKDMADARKDGTSNKVLAEPDRKAVNEELRRYFTTLDMTGVEVMAVEQEFLADIGLTDSRGHVVPLHGKIDAVLRNDEGVWLVEHKRTGRRWHQGQFDFAYQGRAYPVAWQAVTGERPVGVVYNFFLPKETEQRAVYVSEAEQRGVLTELMAAAYMRDEVDIVREPHWGCTDCWYRSLCVTELQGGDAAAVRETQYVMKPALEMPEMEAV